MDINFTDPKTYDKLRNSESRFHIDKYKKMFENIELKKDFTVLEWGCGTGIYSKLLKQDFDKVISIDIDGKMTELAKQKIDAGASFCNADCRKLPIQSGSIDLVMGVSVLHHIKEYHVAMKEAFRVLKKGGHAVFFEPNKLNPMTSIFQALQKEPSMSRFELKRAFVESGLTPVEFREVIFRYMSFPKVKEGSWYLQVENIFENLHMGVTLLSVAKKE